MMAWLFGAGVLLMVVGTAGTVLPVLPGPPLVFAGMLLAAWADGFQRVGWGSLLLLGGLTAVTVAIDVAAAAWGTQRLQASPQAMIGAAVGSLLGLATGVVGLIVGPFVGAVAGEYLARRELRRAGKVGLAAWLGMIVGGAARLAIVFVMLAWFAFAFFVV